MGAQGLERLLVVVLHIQTLRGVYPVVCEEGGCGEEREAGVAQPEGVHRARKLEHRPHELVLKNKEKKNNDRVEQI